MHCLQVNRNILRTAGSPQHVHRHVSRAQSQPQRSHWSVTLGRSHIVFQTRTRARHMSTCPPSTGLHHVAARPMPAARAHTTRRHCRAQAVTARSKAHGAAASCQSNARTGTTLSARAVTGLSQRDRHHVQCRVPTTASTRLPHPAGQASGWLRTFLKARAWRRTATAGSGAAAAPPGRKTAPRSGQRASRREAAAARNLGQSALWRKRRLVVAEVALAGAHASKVRLDTAFG